MQLTLHNLVINDIPRLEANLRVQKLAATITNLQYKAIHSLVKKLPDNRLQKRYYNFRPFPQQSLENRSRALWKYALNVDLHELRKGKGSWTSPWEGLRSRRNDRLLYLAFFKLKLAGQISSSEAQSLEELEQKLTFEDICCYRSRARWHLQQEMRAAALYRGQGVKEAFDATQRPGNQISRPSAKYRNGPACPPTLFVVARPMEMRGFRR